jgi:hypothetical protein
MNELRNKREVSGKASAIPSTRLLPLTAYHWPPTQGLMRDQPEQDAVGINRVNAGATGGSI